MHKKIFNISSPYHWDNRLKASSDFQYIQNLKIELLEELSIILNKLHDTNLSIRAWDIIIGYWLNMFITITFDRWSILQNKKFSEIIKTHKNIIDIEIDNFPLESSDANSQFISEEWNEIFFNQIITELNGFQTKVLKKSSNQKKISNINFRKKIKNLIKMLLNKIYSFPYSGDKSYVFVSCGLSYISLFKLYFKLAGTIYLEPSFIGVSDKDYLQNKRNCKIPVNLNDSKFEILLKRLIPIWMPLSYVENFNKIIEKLNKKQDLPKKIDVIFSAGSQLSNDVFKIWTAINIDKGTKLVCGQHGSGPFHKFNGGHKYEINISDLYVTTGNGNVYPSNLRDVGQFNSKWKIDSWNPKGPAILITVAMPKYASDLRSMPIANQMLKYFEDQYEFYRSLPVDIQKEMIVRLYQKDYGWKIKQGWLKNFPEIRIDEYFKKTLSSSARNCRLIISTYNATTYNQSLAANVPTVIYWDKELWEWSNYADNDFIALKSVGIFHETPESAATHIKNIWHNVSDWWYDSNLQKVRINFCRKYAHRFRGIEKKLANVLEEASSQVM